LPNTKHAPHPKPLLQPPQSPLKKGSKTITNPVTDEEDELITNDDDLDESMMNAEDMETAEDQKPVVSFHPYKY